MVNSWGNGEYTQVAVVFGGHGGHCGVRHGLMRRPISVGCGVGARRHHRGRLDFGPVSTFRRKLAHEKRNEANNCAALPPLLNQLEETGKNWPLSGGKTMDSKATVIDHKVQAASPPQFCERATKPEQQSYTMMDQSPQIA